MAILTKGQTFANADTVTSTKLNALVDSATFVTGASGATDDTSLEVNGSGRLQIKDLGVTSAKIAASGVTTTKIASATGASDGVTYAKLQHVANMRVIGNVSGSLAAPSEVSILDEDTMSSNSATAIPTQQSVKAYVDTEVLGVITYGTIQASTSGTAIDYTSIPSTVKRITILLKGVSGNSVNSFTIQIGDSGGIETTGYISTVTTDSARSTSTTSFFITEAAVAAYTYTGIVTLVRLDASSNIWIQSGIIGEDAQVHSSAGYKSLSGTLDRVRITRNTSGAFDAGEVNICYE
jgi:hypothetical protein